MLAYSICIIITNNTASAFHLKISNRFIKMVGFIHHSEVEKFRSSDAVCLIWVTSELQHCEGENTSGLFSLCPYV